MSPVARRLDTVEEYYFSKKQKRACYLEKHNTRREI